MLGRPTRPSSSIVDGSEQILAGGIVEEKVGGRSIMYYQAQPQFQLSPVPAMLG